MGINYSIEKKKKIIKMSDSTVKFFAIGDFGSNCPEIKKTAAAMNTYAETIMQPDFILGLGDNFYYSGVRNVDSPLFQKIWRSQFTDPYPTLRVPWRMVLGNHDYYDNPTAQIEYHYSEKYNADRLWYLPDRCYQFSAKAQVTRPSNATTSDAPSSSGSSIQGAPPTVDDDTTSIDSNTSDGFYVDFFALDTNGADEEMQYDRPELISNLHSDIAELYQNASASQARWKILFGHHPCYTGSAGHGRAGQRLRNLSDYQYYTNNPADPQTLPGFGLEPVLEDCGVDAYFASHEHVFQHYVAAVSDNSNTTATATTAAATAVSSATTTSSSENQKPQKGSATPLSPTSPAAAMQAIHHFCCGASGAEIRPLHGLIGGRDPDLKMNWMGTPKQYGFVAVEIGYDMMNVKFIAATTGAILREINVYK
jgi:tartrate-resistant acid phosphatase type 5